MMDDDDGGDDGGDDDGGVDGGDDGGDDDDDAAPTAAPTAAVCEDNHQFVDSYGDGCSSRSETPGKYPWEGECHLDKLVTSCDGQLDTCEVGGFFDGVLYYTKAEMDEVRKECPQACRMCDGATTAAPTAADDDDAPIAIEPCAKDQCVCTATNGAGSMTCGDFGIGKCEDDECWDTQDCPGYGYECAGDDPTAAVCEDNHQFVDSYGDGCSSRSETPGKYPWEGECHLDKLVTSCDGQLDTCEVGGFFDGVLYYTKAEMDEVRKECPRACRMCDGAPTAAPTAADDDDAPIATEPCAKDQCVCTATNGAGSMTCGDFGIGKCEDDECWDTQDCPGYGYECAGDDPTAAV